MPSGAAETLTAALGFAVLVAAPATLGHAAPAATASATPIPAPAARFRPRHDSPRTVTVNPPFIISRNRYSLNRTNYRT